MVAAASHISPLRYPGGKSRIWEHLAAQYTQAPLGELDAEIWFEPFAGGLGAGLKMLQESIIGELWFCEANRGLGALWGELVANPTALIDTVSSLPERMSLDVYQEALAVLAAPDSYPQLQVAVAALVVNRCSRSGMVTPTTGPIGGKQQDGKYRVGDRWNLPRTISTLEKLAPLTRYMRFVGPDGISALAGLPNSGFAEEVFVFADPPYVGAGQRLYQHGLDESGHRALADALHDLDETHWVLAYDEAPLVRELYEGLHIQEYTLHHTANRSKSGAELLIYGPGTHPVSA